MKPTELNLCAQCRQELAWALDMEEVPGSAVEKTTCAYCRKRSYGGKFIVSDKKRRDKDV